MSNRQPGRGPAVTMAVVAYKQEAWIEQAVQGAFAQTYSPLQIILSDDASPDQTLRIMSDLASKYVGPHQVVLNENPRNLGLAGHLNRIAELAAGDIIVVAAGDDVSLPHRVASLVTPFVKNPATMAVLSGYTTIGPDRPWSTVCLPRDFGPFTGLEAVAKSGGWVGMGATFAYARACFTTPAKLPDELISEDRLLPFRAALLGQIAFVPDPLVLYRIHEDSSTALGHFLPDAYEVKHQEMLLDELNWARSSKIVDERTYRRVKRALENYPRHLVRARRLDGLPMIARAYSVVYYAGVWRRRLALRLSTSFPPRAKS